MSNVAFAGVVGSEVRLAETNSKNPVCSFRMAVNERVFNAERGEWTDGPTSWYTVVAYNQLALNIAESLKTGLRVNVIGRQQVRDWEAQGRKGTNIEITAASVGVDMQFGRVEFVRVQRINNSIASVQAKAVSQPELPIEEEPEFDIPSEPIERKASKPAAKSAAREASTEGD